MKQYFYPTIIPNYSGFLKYKNGCCECMRKFKWEYVKEETKIRTWGQAWEKSIYRKMTIKNA